MDDNRSQLTYDKTVKFPQWDMQWTQADHEKLTNYVKKNGIEHTGNNWLSYIFD